LAQVYRSRVERLQEALADPEIRDEAFEILRGLIEMWLSTPATIVLRSSLSARSCG
jgi:hypothetical protein